MTDTQSEFAKLSSRLTALEKSNRRWRLVGLALVLVLFAVVLSGPKSYAVISAAFNHPTAVTAKEFILKDSGGNVRGRIAVVHGVPMIEFYNAAGQLWWFAPPKFGPENVAK